MTALLCPYGVAVRRVDSAAIIGWSGIETEPGRAGAERHDVPSEKKRKCPVANDPDLAGALRDLHQVDRASDKPPERSRELHAEHNGNTLEATQTRHLTE